jgi:phage recombination protein Bet
MAYAPMTVAPRHTKPHQFSGSEVAWRTLCDLYPSAESVEVVLAVLDYCAMRKLDPYKKPVHIVPMYNSRVRRKVQVVMPGINEIETTAHRTGKWAGMDPPEWGKLVERTFRGQVEDEQTGERRAGSVSLQFPLSCRVTVYKMVDGARQPFTEELFWEESYGRAGFRSEVPNARWQQAPRQMLHKCVKAAVLRATFPEEGFGYAAEEMEDREVEAGMTIDGVAEREAANPPAERPAERIENAADPAAPPARKTWAVLVDEIEAAFAGADSRAAIDRVLASDAVQKVLDQASANVRERLDRVVSAALRRFPESIDAPTDAPEADAPPSEPAPEPAATEDYRIATPTLSYTFAEPISWLGKWDELIAAHREQPNDLRALHTMNATHLRQVADADLASEMEVQQKIARALRTADGRR